MLEGCQSACRWHKDRQPWEPPLWHLPCLTNKMLPGTACWSCKKSIDNTLPQHQRKSGNVLNLSLITALLGHHIYHRFLKFTWLQCCQSTPGPSPYQLPTKDKQTIYCWNFERSLMRRYSYWNKEMSSPSDVESQGVLGPSGCYNYFLFLQMCPLPFWPPWRTRFRLLSWSKIINFTLTKILDPVLQR